VLDKAGLDWSNRLLAWRAAAQRDQVPEDT
jgi:hypothetical protein